MHMNLQTFFFFSKNASVGNMFQKRIEFTNKFWCSSNETYKSIGKPVYKSTKYLVVFVIKTQKKQTPKHRAIARARTLSFTNAKHNINAVMCAQCLHMNKAIQFEVEKKMVRDEFIKRRKKSCGVYTYFAKEKQTTTATTTSSS